MQDIKLMDHDRELKISRRCFQTITPLIKSMIPVQLLNTNVPRLAQEQYNWNW